MVPSLRQHNSKRLNVSYESRVCIIYQEHQLVAEIADPSGSCLPPPAVMTSSEHTKMSPDQREFCDLAT